jgi:hypothetical protein
LLPIRPSTYARVPLGWWSLPAGPDIHLQPQGHHFVQRLQPVGIPLLLRRARQRHLQHQPHLRHSQWNEPRYRYLDSSDRRSDGSACAAELLRTYFRIDCMGLPQRWRLLEFCAAVSAPAATMDEAPGSIGSILRSDRRSDGMREFGSFHSRRNLYHHCHSNLGYRLAHGNLQPDGAIDRVDGDSYKRLLQIRVRGGTLSITRFVSAGLVFCLAFSLACAQKPDVASLKAAVQGGYAKAAMTLGHLYETGDGVCRSVDLAYDYYAKAAMLCPPDPGARGCLESCRQPEEYLGRGLQSLAQRCAAGPLSSLRKSGVGGRTFSR